MTTTNYIWDEQNYLAEADETNTINVVYTNEPQQYGNLISTRLPVSGTPTSFYHHFDALGSTRQLSKTAGAVSDTVTYDAWGNAINRSGTTAVMLLWIGEVGYYFDLETGVIYVRHRPYIPSIARWTAVDPVDTLLQYLYSLNAPTVLVDPSGLAPRNDIVQKTIAALLEFLSGVDFSKSRCTAALPLIPFQCGLCGDATLETTWKRSVTVNHNLCDALGLIRAPYRTIMNAVVALLNKLGEERQVHYPCIAFICPKCCNVRNRKIRRTCEIQADIPYTALAGLITSNIWGGVAGLIRRLPAGLIASIAQSSAQVLLAPIKICSITLKLKATATLDGDIGNCK